MIHGRAGGEFRDKAGKFRRSAPTPRRVRHVVAEKPHGEYAAAMRAGDACGRMQREHVKAHRVARFECPAENVESIAGGLDIRQIGERALGEPFGLGIHERARHQPWPPVRAGHEFQSRFAIHRIGRDPEADVLPALDIVVGLILVPRRRLPGARLLGQHVIVVKPRAACFASAGPPLRASGDVEDEAPVRGVVLPIAEILDEPARVIRTARYFGARTQSPRFSSMPARSNAISSGRNNSRRHAAPSR